MSQVRLANSADIMRIVDMVEDLCAAVEGMMPVNRPWTAQVVAGLIDNPQGVVFVTEGGFIAGSIQATVINPAKVAMEHGWMAKDRSGAALLRAFEQWAADNGADYLKLSTGAIGPDLGRSGYTMTEKTWVKRI